MGHIFTFYFNWVYSFTDWVRARPYRPFLIVVSVFLSLFFFTAILRRIVTEEIYQVLSIVLTPILLVGLPFVFVALRRANIPWKNPQHKPWRK